MSEKSVLSSKIGGGPHGIGDPNDKTLRKVETEVLIPQKMREIAKLEKCASEVAAFTECCRNSSLAMVVTCRSQNQALKDCLLQWYQNEEFRERCKNEYLAERSEFRRTGISKKKKRLLSELEDEIASFK